MPVDRQQLGRYIDDYSRISRRKVDRFVCPITERECDESELIDGHVLNKAIISASNKQVIQYGKVDHFFGSVVEEPFIRFINKSEESTTEKIRHGESLTITFSDGSEAKGFIVTKANKLAAAEERFPSVTLQKDGELLPLNVFLRIPKDDPRLTVGVVAVNWTMKYMPSHGVASMVKAAYLAAFDLLGYRMMFTPYGEYVRQVLHSFYRDNCDRRQAEHYFYPFRNACKIILNRSTRKLTKDLPDTLHDRSVIFHSAPSGLMFAASFVFKVNQAAIAVALPMSMAEDWATCERVMRLYNSLMENETSVKQLLQVQRLTDKGWECDHDPFVIPYDNY